MSEHTATFIHKKSETDVKDGKVVVYDEKIIDGPKGVIVKLYSKSNNKILDIVGGERDGVFFLNISEPGKEKKVHEKLTKAKFIKELEGFSEMAFSLDYLKKMKEKVASRISHSMSRSQSSRKSHKKTNKKSSKKASKKHRK